MFILWLASLLHLAELGEGGFPGKNSPAGHHLNFRSASHGLLLSSVKSDGQMSNVRTDGVNRQSRAWLSDRFNCLHQAEWIVMIDHRSSLTTIGPFPHVGPATVANKPCHQHSQPHSPWMGG